MSNRGGGWRTGLIALTVWTSAEAVARARTTLRVLDQTVFTSGDHTRAGRAPLPPSGGDGEGLPYHDAVVALVNPRGFACSGVLIHRRAVLSARHCIGALTVVFGANVDELVERRSIVRTRPVPNAALDLALFVLDAAAPVEPYPIAVPATPPATLRIVGFGCTDGECLEGSGRRSYFDALMRPDDWGCSVSASAETGCIPQHEMVLSRAQAADTCTGDSGGPVLERKGRGWAVVAITSRAVSHSVLQCGDGGIYVRLLTHEKWLRTEIGRL